MQTHNLQSPEITYTLTNNSIQKTELHLKQEDLKRLKYHIDIISQLLRFIYIRLTTLITPFCMKVCMCHPISSRHGALGVL